MRKRGLALLLILTVVIAVATIVQDYRFDRSLAREREATLAVDRDLDGVATTLASLRAAEAGYVAAGQGPTFWTSRATDLFSDIEATMFRLRTATLSAEARERYEAAGTAFNDLKAIDARARDNVRSNPFVASDLIFVDALQAADKLSAELSGARTAEIAAADGRMTRLGQLRLGMNATALLFIALVAVTASRANREEDVSPAATTARMLRDLPPPVKGPVASSPQTPAVATATGNGNGHANGVAATPRLSEAAELCVDLARVIDGRDLPGLLARVTTLLEAKGVVVWRADLAGAMLHPSLSHGYSDKVVARLGTLAVDGENVTSLAFRSLRTQSVGGGPGTPGAIAVPLVTASGCVGVLAAETRQGKPAGEVLSLARILAAQLSTMIAPIEDAPSNAAEA